MINQMHIDYRKVKESFMEKFEKRKESETERRAAILNKNAADLQTLFDKRKQMEESDFFQNRRDSASTFQEKMVDMEVNDANQYTKTKLQLEMGIQSLEKHLEDTIASNQLNQDKLEYNLKGLAERNKDNTALISILKAKLSKMRETNNQLKIRYEKCDNLLRSQNCDYTTEFRRLAAQLRQLQGKSRQFENADEKKFREVWDMKEEDARSLIKKITDADKTFHEEILGLPWRGLGEDDDSYGFGDGISEIGTLPGRSITGMSDATRTSEGVYSANKVKKVFELIASEAAFLLDIRVKDERSAAKAIMDSLSIENQQEINLLVEQFYKGQDPDDEFLVIGEDDVLEKIQDFLHEKENLGGDLGPVKSGKRKEKRKRIEADFWENMSKTYTNVYTWKSIDFFFEKYLNLLQARQNSILNLKKLEKENKDLTQLMDEYLAAQANESLIIPPTKVIKCKQISK
eukprot:GHVL01043092.1.p1 GENE.GHVL01043092.1~~GHVL01043092.1.p1  ORF type:complete len:460 (+),score=117.77 GHVL01043092.1:493-1872(+)